MKRRMTKSRTRIEPKMLRLLFLKSFILVYLCLISFTLFVFHWRPESLGAFIMSLEYSIRNASIYSYFTSFWQISRGFHFINQQLEKLRLSKYGRRKHGQEIRDLWVLHSRLSHMAERVNRIYGLQMLLSRLDYMAFSIIYGYVGILFLRSSLSALKLVGASIYFLRTVDFFLNDYICELTTRYQSQPKHRITEGKMSKEVD
ncbi:hypothetical protein KR009_003542, partial [Drosophila setifemur]